MTRPRPTALEVATDLLGLRPARDSRDRDRTADMIRDDGSVLYVNGVEVGRNNMPTGPIASNTLATATISDRAQELTPVTFQVSSSAFHAGTNSVAVEVHGSDPYTGDLSFDLKLTGRP